jgi:hypothetical protein
MTIAESTQRERPLGSQPGTTTRRAAIQMIQPIDSDQSSRRELTKIATVHGADAKELQSREQDGENYSLDIPFHMARYRSRH